MTCLLFHRFFLPLAPIWWLLHFVAFFISFIIFFSSWICGFFMITFYYSFFLGHYCLCSFLILLNYFSVFLVAHGASLKFLFSRKIYPFIGQTADHSFLWGWLLENYYILLVMSYLIVSFVVVFSYFLKCRIAVFTFEDGVTSFSLHWLAKREISSISHDRDSEAFLEFFLWICLFHTSCLLLWGTS